MDWITASIATAAILGVVAIINSHLLSKRLPSLWSFLLPVSIMHLTFGLVVLGINPLPEGVGTTPLLVAFGSGIIRGIGAAMMLNVMRSREISRIISVTHTFPIFVAILAVPLLGEALGYMEWLAILITVGGAILISVQRNTDGSGLRLDKSFAVLLGSSLLMGIANIGNKFALDYVSFWNMYSINAISLSTVFLILSGRPRVVRELRDMKQRGAALGLLTVNEVIALGGLILYVWAMEQGPVSLVSTIISVRPAFVFIYALALSRVFPAVLGERLSRGIIMVKVISIALIIGGVTLLTLGV